MPVIIVSVESWKKERVFILAHNYPKTTNNILSNKDGQNSPVCVHRYIIKQCERHTTHFNVHIHSGWPDEFAKKLPNTLCNCQKYYITWTVEKSTLWMWATSVFFKELTKVNNHYIIGRKFSQSGHPDCTYICPFCIVLFITCGLYQLIKFKRPFSPGTVFRKAAWSSPSADPFLRNPWWGVKGKSPSCWNPCRRQGPPSDGTLEGDSLNIMYLFALAAWRSGHRIHLSDKKTRVRISPGYKVFRKT
jgi:hypothetical protein